MLLVIGTLPEPDLPVVAGQAGLTPAGLTLKGHLFPVTRGTAALLAAAAQALEFLGQPRPSAFLAGDIGLGEGSRRLYDYAAAHLGEQGWTAVVGHYILPLVDGHSRVLMAWEELAPRPRLLADAGFMYVAKMSGYAHLYDLFTPDAGELAFLADEQAPHPFYTRGFILKQEEKVPELVARAYAHDNASRCLLVKGRTDYVACREGILAMVSEPEIPALEAMGGTGDTLTGLAAALISAGREVCEAAHLAARLNRLAGALARPTPASPVTELIARIPQALEEILGG